MIAFLIRSTCQHVCVCVFVKERGLLEPNSKEDAQRLWEMERQRVQETLRRQKQEMLEDNKWLEKEEKLLVSHQQRLSLKLRQCAILAGIITMSLSLE